MTLLWLGASTLDCGLAATIHPASPAPKSPNTATESARVSRQSVTCAAPIQIRPPGIQTLKAGELAITSIAACASCYWITGINSYATASMKKLSVYIDAATTWLFRRRQTWAKTKRSGTDETRRTVWPPACNQRAGMSPVIRCISNA